MLGSVVDGWHDAVVHRANGWLQSHVPSTLSASLVGTVVPPPACFLVVTPQAAAITAKAERAEPVEIAWRRVTLGSPPPAGAPSTRRSISSAPSAMAPVRWPSMRTADGVAVTP